MIRKINRSTLTNVGLNAIALSMASIIYLININVTPSISIGSVYCLVILYSWILKGKYASFCIGIFCTVLIILALIKNVAYMEQGSLEGLNSFVSIIVLWVSVTLVTVAKTGYAGLETAMASLEVKVEERTQDLKINREQLVNNEKIYRQLYENANEMYASVDVVTNTILRCNATLCKRLGYSKSELVGKPISFLHQKESLVDLNIGLQLFKKRGGAKNVNLNLITRSGEIVEVILNIISTKNDHGGIINSRFSWTDISELKQIENERIVYAAALEVKNKELEQFAFIASHDLQEPLRTITSFSGLLVQEYLDKFDQTGKDSLQFIVEATSRMQNLVKGLLDYSRIGNDLEKTKINTREILNNLKMDLSYRIEETKAVVEYENIPEFIYGSERDLRQLLQNLIANAIKFCKTGIEPRVQISAIRKNDFVEFCVKDNGIGIPKQQQHKIFKIFKRLHIREEYEGTGIGLAHCQKIVDLHGGQIWVDSELGTGSKFFFTLSNT